MDNLQRAINYETVVSVLKKSDLFCMQCFSKIEEESEPGDIPVANLALYSQILGAERNTIENEYNTVKAAFRNIPSSVKIIDSTSKYWPSDVRDQMFLYLMGDPSLLKARGICIVGTRTPTQRGTEIAKKAADRACRTGLTVISGLAKGIDGIAHLQTLSSQGRTVAVIGTPVNTCYPAEHRQLQYMIAEHGLVVSQFAPSRETQKYFFMLRNLLMSQIGCATFVAEDRDGGGAVQQARYSEKQGKPVFLLKETYENRSILWPRSFEKPSVIATPEALQYSLEPSVIANTVQKKLKAPDNNNIQPSLFD